jgi:ferredoxin-NADP reductase
VYHAPTNIESAYITALILACILSPVRNFDGLPLLFWAGTLAMASKYILAIKQKHLFNPAAVAVALTAFWLNQPATWWVGTTYMLPIVLLGGLLVIRKLRRFDMVLTCVLAAVVASGIFTILQGHDVLHTLSLTFIQTPLLFFAFIMVTEPLTSPSTKAHQVVYGGIVGILAAPQTHFGSLYFTPELALLVGNIYAYLVNSKVRTRLLLKSITPVALNTYEFSFAHAGGLHFKPGQYMEFTLPHQHADARGNRRYFTVASSPTEEELKLGVKFYGTSSSFKQRMQELQPNDLVMAGQLAGDFTLPHNPNQSVVFIAGGIGITPFRSMVKCMSDTNQARPTTLFYSNKQVDEIAYKPVFDQAATTIGLKTVYLLTEEQPENWTGKSGYLTAEMIKEEVPQFQNALFYISGPHGMVVATEKLLASLHIPSSHIKKDFFPGLV